MKSLMAVVLGWCLTGCLGSGIEHALPPEDGAILLRLDPPVGLVTHYRTTMESGGEFEMTGGPTGFQPPTTRMLIFSRDSVCAAEGDVRHVVSVTDSVKADAEGSSGAPGQLAQLAERMKGWTVDSRVTTRGEWVAWETADSTMIPEHTGTPFNRVGGSDARASQMVLPENPVRPGDTWVASPRMSVALGGTAMGSEMEVVYRFEGLSIRDGVRLATISFRGPMKIDGPMDLVLMGEMSGSLELDLNAGRIHSNKVTSSATGSGEIMGQAVTMYVRSGMEQTILR